MRIFEALTLIDADAGVSIQERRFTEEPVIDGGLPRVVAVEWWGVMGVTVHQNGRPVGQKPVPFRIDAATRAEAFANLERCMHEASEGAKRQVAEEIQAAERRVRSTILVAEAGGRPVASALGGN